MEKILSWSATVMANASYGIKEIITISSNQLLLYEAFPVMVANKIASCAMKIYTYRTEYVVD